MLGLFIFLGIIGGGFALLYYCLSQIEKEAKESKQKLIQEIADEVEKRLKNAK